jgi:hypothetical protein
MLLVRRRITVVALLGISLGPAACASHHGSSRVVEAGSARHVLYASELSGTPYPSLLEAIQALRGEWLHKRGPTSLNVERDVVIYLDGNRLGGPSKLREISTMLVISVRYLAAPEAQSYFGLSHPYGAIVVTTKT